MIKNFIKSIVVASTLFSFALASDTEVKAEDKSVKVTCPMEKDGKVCSEGKKCDDAKCDCKDGESCDKCANKAKAIKACDDEKKCDKKSKSCDSEKKCDKKSKSCDDKAKKSCGKKSKSAIYRFGSIFKVLKTLDLTAEQKKDLKIATRSYYYTLAKLKSERRFASESFTPRGFNKNLFIANDALYYSQKLEAKSNFVEIIYYILTPKQRTDFAVAINNVNEKNLDSNQKGTLKGCK